MGGWILNVVLVILAIITIANTIVMYLKIKTLAKNILTVEDEKSHILKENSVLNKELSILTSENQELNKLARLVRQSPNAIMLMDKDGNVYSVNKGFEDMYEYNYYEFIAARGSNYRKTSFSSEVIERIERIEKTKKPVIYEALNITKSGKELWTQTALVPILDEKGNLDGMVTIDTDIHQRFVTSDNLIQTMEAINDKIDHMAEQFKVLTGEAKSLFERINESKQLIEQTDQIVKFIKEISDKTKILGINASIEASIAGSHGRGFRVIANEIVEISNKTINSVSQISSLLSSVSIKQDELSKEKAESENAITEHQKLIKLLKNEISDVENAIAKLKSLT